MQENTVKPETFPKSPSLCDIDTVTHSLTILINCPVEKRPGLRTAVFEGPYEARVGGAGCRKHLSKNGSSEIQKQTNKNLSLSFGFWLYTCA